MRARTLLLVVLAVLLVAAIGRPGHHPAAGDGTGPTPHTTAPAPQSRRSATEPTPPSISFRPPVHNAPDVDVETLCDENGHAYRIKPDTAPARARAEEMCSNLQRSLDDAGW
jgi:hypothetical protein